MREHIELVYILQNRVEKASYIFSDRLYLEQFWFYHWGAEIIFRFFFDSLKYRIFVFNKRAYGVGVYTPKQSRKGHCIFF